MGSTTTINAALSYGREKLSYITYNVPLLKIVAKLKAFNFEHYKEATPILWLDIPNGSAGQTEPSMSHRNLLSTTMAVDSAMDLVAEDAAESG
jgi:hypothetical protein